MQDKLNHNKKKLNKHNIGGKRKKRLFSDAFLENTRRQEKQFFFFPQDCKSQ